MKFFAALATLALIATAVAAFDAAAFTVKSNSIADNTPLDLSSLCRHQSSLIVQQQQQQSTNNEQQDQLLDYSSSSSSSSRPPLVVVLKNAPMSVMSIFNNQGWSTLDTTTKETPSLMHSCLSLALNSSGDDDTNQSSDAEVSKQFDLQYPYVSSDSLSSMKFIDLKRQLLAIPSSSGFSALTFSLLSTIEQQYGQESQVYQTALIACQEWLLKVSSITDRPVVVVSISTQEDTSNNLHKRRLLSTAAQVTPVVEVVVVNSGLFGVNFTLPFCMPDANTCSNATSLCSNKGNCTLTRGQCYRCQCSHGYTGDACQLVDRIADFHIILWTSVTLLVATVVIVYSMLAMGSSMDGGML